MDKLTKAIVENKMKSLKVGTGKSQQDTMGPSAVMEMMTKWSSDIEAEKEKRRRRHMDEEAKREKMRNKYREKYGLCKKSEPVVKKERNSYILDSSSSSAIEVHSKKIELVPSQDVCTPKETNLSVLSLGNKETGFKRSSPNPRPYSAIGMGLPMPRFNRSRSTTVSSESLNTIYDNDSIWSLSVDDVIPRERSASLEQKRTFSNKAAAKKQGYTSNQVSHLVHGTAHTPMQERMKSSMQRLEYLSQESIKFDKTILNPPNELLNQPHPGEEAEKIKVNHEYGTKNVNGIPRSSSSTSLHCDTSSEASSSNYWENHVLFRYFLNPLLRRLSNTSFSGSRKSPENGKGKDSPAPRSPVLEGSKGEQSLDSTSQLLDESPESRPDQVPEGLNNRVENMPRGFPEQLDYLQRTRCSFRESHLSPPQFSRKSSTFSDKSSCTAFSDPCDLVSTPSNNLPDRSRSTECLSYRERRIRKPGFKNILGSLRRQNHSLKCVELAARGPVLGDHSIRWNEDLSETELETSQKNEENSVVLQSPSSTQTEPETSVRRESACSTRSQIKPLAGSECAAKRAEFLYYKYMGDRARKP